MGNSGLDRAGFRGCGLAGPRGTKAQRMGKEDAGGVEGRR